MQFTLCAITRSQVAHSIPAAVSRFCEPVTHSIHSAYHDAAAKLWAGCILIDVPEGQKLQTRLRALGICLPTIVLGRAGNLQAALSTMKLGAFDFLEKPIDEKVLVLAVDAALRTPLHITGSGRSWWLRNGSRPSAGASARQRVGRGSALQTHCVRAWRQRAHGRSAPHAHVPSAWHSEAWGSSAPRRVG